MHTPRQGREQRHHRHWQHRSKQSTDSQAGDKVEVGVHALNRQSENQNSRQLDLGMQWQMAALTASHPQLLLSVQPGGPFAESESSSSSSSVSSRISEFIRTHYNPGRLGSR